MIYSSVDNILLANSTDSLCQSGISSRASSSSAISDEEFAQTVNYLIGKKIISLSEEMGNKIWTNTQLSQQ